MSIQFLRSQRGNYYIGAQIVGTGYVRDRAREFTDTYLPPKEETLKRLGEAVAMVIETVHKQASADWAMPYSVVGTNCGSRLDITIQCAAHMQHYIGQMIYLGYELKRQAKTDARAE